jgi:hypothetical protein
MIVMMKFVMPEAPYNSRFAAVIPVDLPTPYPPLGHLDHNNLVTAGLLVRGSILATVI